MGDGWGRGENGWWFVVKIIVSLVKFASFFAEGENPKKVEDFVPFFTTPNQNHPNPIHQILSFQHQLHYCGCPQHNQCQVITILLLLMIIKWEAIYCFFRYFESLINMVKPCGHMATIEDAIVH